MLQPVPKTMLDYSDPSSLQNSNSKPKRKCNLSNKKPRPPMNRNLKSEAYKLLPKQIIESSTNFRCETEEIGIYTPPIGQLSQISSNENSFEGDSADLMADLVANERINCCNYNQLR